MRVITSASRSATTSALVPERIASAHGKRPLPFASRAPADGPASARDAQVTAVAAGGREKLHHLANRMSSRGYRVRPTPHFAVCDRPDTPESVVIHTFDETSVDEDLAGFIGLELGELGTITTETEFSDALFAIIASSCEHANTNGNRTLSNLAVWRQYTLNTLAHFRKLLAPWNILNQSPTLLMSLNSPPFIGV